MQCGSTEAKALSFVLHTAGLNIIPVVNQARVYVCSGRAAGGNEQCAIFRRFARYVET